MPPLVDCIRLLDFLESGSPEFLVHVHDKMIIIIVAILLFSSSNATQSRVLVALISRNAENILPFILGGLEVQDFPTKLLDIWIRTDCNIDGTTKLLKHWSRNVKDVYGSVDFDEIPCETKSENFPFIKSDERKKHVESLRDSAVAAAFKKKSDFVFFLDSNAFLVHPSTITDLVASKSDIIGPFLPSLNKYGNFWCNCTSEFRFVSSPDCSSVFELESLGSFRVALVHSAFMISLRNSHVKQLTFSSTVETRPYQKFLESIKSAGLEVLITNQKQYGYCLPPLARGSSLADQLDLLKNLHLEILVSNSELPLSKHVFPDEEDPDTLGFGHAYFINLDRRPERRERLEKSFVVLNLEVERIRAVDGRNLDTDILQNMGIRMLPGYSDPYKKRPMTMGEFGCFLSHYAIWRNIVEKGYESALVFEDDIRFDFYFRRRVQDIWKDINRLNVTWDLIYLGRKRLVEEYEPFIKKSVNLVHVGYSYWTLCYMISRSGALKLLHEKPLSKMVPVDEYLPIMFDRHPNEIWKKHFEARDLVAFSAYPLLVYPTHYTGDKDYISDTEASPALHNDGSNLDDFSIQEEETDPTHDEL